MTFSIQGEPIAFRSYRPDDRNYILSTWLLSERDLVRMRKDWYKAWNEPVIKYWLAHGVFVVACDPEVQGTIYGWACYCPDDESKASPVYAYVTLPLRGKGLAKAMCRGLHVETI